MKKLYTILTLMLGLFSFAHADEKVVKELVLTDSYKFINSVTISSVGSISDNGEKVFLTLVGGIPRPPLGMLPQPPYQQAVLFKNNDGKLEVLSSINVNFKKFPQGSGGGATPDFKNFVVMDSPESGAPSRIRVFNKNLTKVIKKIVLKNFRINDQRLAFTEDGKFFAVNLMNQSTGNNIIRVYTTKTLEKFTDYNAGMNAVNMGTYFQIQHKGEYFAFNLATSPDQGITVTSSSLRILSFDRKAKTLKLVSKTPLPQFAQSVNAFRPRKPLSHTFLTVGTHRADLPGEVSSLQVPSISFLPDDGDELRYYRWDGEVGTEPKLLASENLGFDLTCAAPSTFNNGKSIVVDFWNYPVTSGDDFFGYFNPNIFAFPTTEIFQLREVTKKSTSGVAPQGIGTIVDTHMVGSENLGAQFSLDGKWLIAFGCKEGQTEPAPPNEVFYGITMNLNLFKVVR